jgi:hypothetical protein
MIRAHRSFGVQGRDSSGATLALAASLAVLGALGATLLALDNLMPALRAMTAFAGAAL